MKYEREPLNRRRNGKVLQLDGIEKHTEILRAKYLQMLYLNTVLKNVKNLNSSGSGALIKALRNGVQRWIKS